MCGVVGIFDTQGRQDIDRDRLSTMNDTLTHRGPDGQGTYFEPGLGLGHRRLSIIDIGGGHQPMATPDGNLVISFNGEIYNFQSLRQELEGLGHSFQTQSDTEVLLYAYRAWGEDCVKKLRGMFAFALWDKSAETLFMARDRLGKKPLYYTQLHDGHFIFGSELKALLRHPLTSRKMDETAVADYFAYGYIPDPKCIYKGIYKLLPAHTLTLKRGSPPKTKCYWDLALSAPFITKEEEAIEALQERLKEATNIRMISDVPLGAFLSGGVDSSGIVAMMAQGADKPVNTFAISFGDKDFDESAYASALAERYHTHHRTSQLDPEEFSTLDKLAGMYDEPFGDSSAMPTYRVCAEARKHVTVCLSGDGGDEAFLGYRRYLWHKRESALRALMPSALRVPLFGFLSKAYPKMDWAPQFLRAKNTFQELSMEDDFGFFHSVSVTHDQMRDALFSNQQKQALAGYAPSSVVRDYMAAAGTSDPLQQVQYADMKTWLSGGILTKVDRASMATSLEVRAPLLDHELIEWAVSLSPQLKLNGPTGKYVLKKALEPYVSKDILYRPKQGFSMPLARWFRGPLRDRLTKALTGEPLNECGLFDTQTLNRLGDEHGAGRRDHSAVLWLLLMFDAFLKHQEGG